MKAMIMAAGKGTRLAPITELVPKPMVPIANRPALHHLVRLLSHHGIRDLVMNLHHLPAAISGYFGDGQDAGVRITYSFEPELLGTAGGVKNNQEFLDGDTFLVVSGDALTDLDLAGLIQAHRRNGSIATLAVREVNDPTQYGVVIADDDLKVVGFQEKPTLAEARSRLCNCGIYVFEPAIFEHIPAGEFDDFGRRLFPDLLRRRVPFHVAQSVGYWSDVGSLEEYLRGNADALLGRIRLEIPGEQVRPGVWLDRGCEVDGSAWIEPPVLIGRGCRIGAGVVVEGPAVIGDDCVIERDCHLVRAVVLPHSLIPAGSVVVGGVLGRRYEAHDRRGN